MKKRVGRYHYTTNLNTSASEDVMLKKRGVQHFGVNLWYRSADKYFFSRDSYIPVEEVGRKSSFNHGYTYSHEWYENQKKRALENLDINMELFSKLDADEFNHELDKYIEKLKLQGYAIEEITDISTVKGVPGVYIMVLDAYRQVYIGATGKGIKERIRAHWRVPKPFDRYVFGAVESSKIAIDCFGALDTTRIYAIRTESAERAFEIEHIVDKQFPEKFVLNRIWGGLPTDTIDVVVKLLKKRS